jgi:hypothetical protein
MRNQVLVFCVILLSSFVFSATINQNPLYPTPVTVEASKKISFGDVWPKIDSLLKEKYWYYLRSASIVYQANINTVSEFMFFTIYRNIVGTFLVIASWEKTAQTTLVNTFVRLGNGYE